MSNWLKTAGCECAVCGPDPCTAGSCLCNLTLSTSGGDEGYTHDFDASSDFVTARDIYIDFESYTVKDQLLIYADGVLVYDSGCIGAHVTPTVTIPAGTLIVTVTIVPNCEGTIGTAWDLYITCEAL